MSKTYVAQVHEPFFTGQILVQCWDNGDVTVALRQNSPSMWGPPYDAEERD